MPDNYIIEIKDTITCIRFQVAPEIDDVYQAIDDLVEHYPTQLRLWDASKRGMKLSANDLKKLSSYGREHFPTPGWVAIVAPTETAFTSSQLFEAYRNDDETHVKVFRNEADAIDWLLKMHAKYTAASDTAN